MKLTNEYDIVAEWCVENIIKPSLIILNSNIINTMYCGPAADLILNFYLNKFHNQVCNLEIKKVLYKNPATIVFWEDGSKTAVVCQKNDAYDPEKGLAMAILKKMNGNTGSYYKVFKKWLPKEEENDNV